jgi:hypothetical protein
MSRFALKPSARWQDRFVDLLPVILNYVLPAFGKLRSEAKAEAVQEALANACVAYARLVERGKESLAFATVLARFAVSQVRAGRQVGGRLNILDVASEYCQRRKQFRLQRLDRYDLEGGCWQEAVVQDHRTPVADQVWFRIDFPAWLRTLSRRDRRIAEALADGHRPTDVAQRFQLSIARVSQLRREFHSSWLAFHGEDAAECERMCLLTAA